MTTLLSTVQRLGVLVASLAFFSPVLHATATPGDKLITCEWSDGFEVSGLDYLVSDITSVETPQGVEVYVGGIFRHVNGKPANYVARWRDGEWTTLGGPNGAGFDEPVDALAVWDDGVGPAVYAGGRFTSAGGVEVNHVARWDGTQWQPLGALEDPGVSGGSNTRIWDFAVFDDGGGSALYVAGNFYQAGGHIAPGLARWDGNNWSPVLDQTAPRTFHTVEVWNDGSGDALYVGDEWPARVRDRKLESLGQPPSSSTWTQDLEVMTDATGSALYAAGWDFSTGSFVSKWQDGQWTYLMRDVRPTTVDQLEVFDNGDGPRLHVSGEFGHLGGATLNHIAQWDGTSWLPLQEAGEAPGLGGLFSSAIHAVNLDGPVLLVGGHFTAAGDRRAPYLATWDGAAWGTLDSSEPDGAGIHGSIYDIAEWDDGTGLAVYVAGRFQFASQQRVNHIARWDGNRWAPLVGPGGIGLSGEVEALTVWDDGSGPALFVGGVFKTAGGLEVNGIAKWDGAKWSALQGSQGTGVSGGVNDMIPYDDGSGEKLYVGGFFGLAGGLSTQHVARWNGREWSTLGYPVGVQAGPVYALETFDDGAGEALYVGGFFDAVTSDGFFASNIAKWDATGWYNVDPTDFLTFDFVFDLITSDLDGEPALYTGSSGVKRFDGTSWTYAGGENRIFASPLTLEVWDDGTGPAIYAGGASVDNHVKRFDGTRWTDLDGPMGTGLDNAVWSLGGTSSGALLAGGRFTTAGGLPSAGVAQWRCGVETDCTADPERLLCLGENRFAVDVSWRDFDGNEGSGRVVPFQTDDSGLFYFFGADNWELLVKVLDGCGVNDHFWVFSAATTNVEYTLTVTDSVTGASRSYLNPLGVAAPAVTDTGAFPTCSAGLAGPSSLTAPPVPSDSGVAKSSAPAGPGKADCAPSDTTMCLEGGRFALQIDWRDFEGNEGPGRVVADVPADGSGLFQFFGESNWEVLVKVLDGCSLNDRFWVFSAATTNVEYTLRVTDTETGETVDYFNPLGNAASAITDTDAFAACP